MLTTTLRPTTAVSAVSNRPVRGSANQTAPAPADEAQVDFARIETPQKVVQLPVMDPGFQLTLALGFVSAALLGGFGGVVPKVGIDVVCQSGGTEMRSHHTINIGNQAQPVSGGGYVGDQFSESSVSLSQANDSLTWSESIGSTSTQLRVTTDEGEESLHIQGHVGEVPADLAISPLMNNQEELVGFHTMGQLGGRPYTLDTLFHGMDGAGLEASHGQLLVRGHADGASIIKDYEFSIEEREDGLSAALHGGGMTAGVPQAVSIKLDITIPEDQG